MRTPTHISNKEARRLLLYLLCTDGIDFYPLQTFSSTLMSIAPPCTTLSVHEGWGSQVMFLSRGLYDT